MASFPVDFKPKNTDWFRCSTEIEFNCEQPPKRISDIPYQIVGFGFIFGHKYDIETSVSSYRRQSCHIDGCGTGVRYDGELLVLLTETVGVAFGFGKGTVAFGYTPRPRRSTERFETPCICCDSPAPSQTSVNEKPAVPVRDSAAMEVLATTAAATSVAAALVVARAFPNLGLNPYLEQTVLGFAGLALIAAFVRSMRALRTQSDDTTKPQVTGSVR